MLLLLLGTAPKGRREKAGGVGPESRSQLEPQENVIVHMLKASGETHMLIAEEEPTLPRWYAGWFVVSHTA